VDTQGTTIAILGGGQLGQMLGQAGAALGLRFRFLDPADAPPAATVGPCIRAALDDPGAVDALIADADVVTYEWEGVPADAVARIGDRLRPNVTALGVSQDRLVEKRRFAALDIATAPFVAVDTLDDLHAALATLGTPAILKTRTGGYDGKGQVVMTEPDDAATAWQAIAGAPAILEGFVTFARELSIIAARDHNGAIACFPLVENAHDRGILRTSIAPAPDVTDAQRHEAESFATRLLDNLGYVGVLTLELFDTPAGLVANEFAPRVHNSGHWTIEGAATSQFEQHLRAIANLPLGDPAAVGVSAMCNCIGALPDPSAIAAIPDAHLHTYGKSLRTGRKVGHVTITAPDRAALAERLAAVQAVLPADG
jgi:5-(carboxyamino)imidazole ribonucleotide synthase